MLTEPSADKPVLVVAAVSPEVRRWVDVQPEAKAARQEPIGWQVHDVHPALSVLVAGIGRSNAAAATAHAMTKRHFAWVINLGVAGALPGSGLAPGAVVVADESVFWEEGIELPTGPAGITDLGFALGRPPWAEGNRMIADAQLVETLQALIGDDRHGLTRIATVARCSGTDQAAEQVARHTGAVAEAMEGASVLLAAYRMGAHGAAELRVISNTCGDRARQEWNLAAALARLDEIQDRLAEWSAAPAS